MRRQQIEKPRPLSLVLANVSSAGIYKVVLPVGSCDQYGEDGSLFCVARGHIHLADELGGEVMSMAWHEAVSCPRCFGHLTPSTSEHVPAASEIFV